MPTGYAVPCPAGALNEKGEQSHVATFVPLPVLGSLNGMWHGGWVSFASDFGGTTLRLAFGMDGKVTREISDFVLEPGIRRKGVPIEANEAVCSVINKGPGDVTAWVEAF